MVNIKERLKNIFTPRLPEEEQYYTIPPADRQRILEAEEDEWVGMVLNQNIHNPRTLDFIDEARQASRGYQ